MRWFQAWKVYPQLPMKVKTVLPDAGFEPMPIILNDNGWAFMVHCLPKGKGKHRVMAQCHCGRYIPFGRMGQHYPIHN